MQNRIEKLFKYIEQSRSIHSIKVSKICAAVLWFSRDNLLTQYVDIFDRTKVTTKKSEHERGEECDALVFFIAMIQRYQYPYININQLLLPPHFKRFIDKITGGKLIDKEECYHEMIYWGFYILNKYQAAKKANTPLAVELETQKILKKFATPKIFVEPMQYKEDLLKTKASRYEQYVTYREAYRAETVPTLKSRLMQSQSHKRWTVACLIPGVYWLKYGWLATWELMCNGRLGWALACFLGTAVLSAFSPLCALLHYAMCSSVERETKDKIAQADVSKDYVVTRVYTQEEYKSLKNFRSKLQEEYKEIFDTNALKILKTPRKHIVEFKDEEGPKVKVYMDQKEAERLVVLNAVKNGENKDAAGFFKSLKASKLESIEMVRLLHLDREKKPQESAPF